MIASKEFKKMATTVIISAIVFFSLGMLAVKVADENSVRTVEIHNNYNLDDLVDAKDSYIKVRKENTLYGINQKQYKIFIVDEAYRTVKEWQYLTN